MKHAISFIVFALALTVVSQGRAESQSAQADIDLSRCLGWGNSPCESLYKGVLEFTLQVDQIAANAVFSPKVRVLRVGDINDTPGSVTYNCVYDYTAPVARATVMVKTQQGKVISNSQDELIGKFSTVSGTVASENDVCPSLPKERGPFVVDVSPNLRFDLSSKILMVIRVKGMTLKSGSQTTDSNGAVTLSDLQITAPEKLGWILLPTDEPNSGVFGEAHFKNSAK